MSAIHNLGPPLWQLLLIGAAVFAPFLLCVLVAWRWFWRRSRCPRVRWQRAARRLSINDRRVRRRLGMP